MTLTNKILRHLAGVVICSLLLTGGCTPAAKEGAKPALEPQAPKAATAEEITKPQPPVSVKPPSEPEKSAPQTPAKGTAALALKFNNQDSTNYRVVLEYERSVKFKGSLTNDNSLKGGRTGRRIEMTFNQKIQNVDENGNAVAKITIEGLKYLSKVKDDTAMDFDSSRVQDQNNPLNKLIGQSYTIKIAPTGEVLNVIDTSQAMSAVRGTSAANQRAMVLLVPETIKELLTVSALPDKEKNQLRTGDSWSRNKSFDFGTMGTRNYERIYTVKEIKDTGNRQTAVIEMSFLPAPETAEQTKEGEVGSISDMFDTNEMYTGLLKLDLTGGKIEEYSEKLESEWVIVDPQAEQKSLKEKEPDTLIMGVVNLHSIEKID